MDTGGLSLPFSLITVASLLGGTGTGMTSLFSNEWMVASVEGVGSVTSEVAENVHKGKGTFQQAVAVWETDAKCQGWFDALKCKAQSVSNVKDKIDDKIGNKGKGKDKGEDSSNHSPSKRRSVRILRSLLKRLCISGQHSGCGIKSANVKKIVFKGMEMASEKVMAAAQWVYVSHLVIISGTTLMVFRKIWTRQYDRGQIRVCQGLIGVGGLAGLLATMTVVLTSSLFTVGVGSATAFVGSACVFTAAATLPHSFRTSEKDQEGPPDDGGFQEKSTFIAGYGDVRDYNDNDYQPPSPDSVSVSSGERGHSSGSYCSQDSFVNHEPAQESGQLVYQMVSSR